MIPQRTCIDIIGLTRCTGCFACQAACSQMAIKLALDADGFYRPIIDPETCNGCGICQQRCPVISDQEGILTDEKWFEPPAFAAWSNDDQVRLGSSSGGLFSELARPVIEAGGAVAGCVWGENWTPIHILANTWADVERMRGSKYVPSHVGDIYSQVIASLRNNDKSVLFSGTPCQVAAMEVALSSEQRKRTLLVEFICHGVPSLRVFHSYLGELFGGDAVASYTFRDKALGWQTTTTAISENGQRHHMPAPKDAFFQGFACHHLYVMESCHQCSFARLPRGGDITLGDFWGCPAQWMDKRGVSLVLANTPAGLAALEKLSESGRINLRSSELGSALLHNRRAFMSGTYSMPGSRRTFLDGLASGCRFTQLKARYFPSRRQLWCRSFLKSESKWQFVASFVSRFIRRYT